MKGRHHFGYLGVDERIILKCVSKKLLGNARTCLLSLKTGATGGL
jgi:hypothetical protein